MDWKMLGAEKRDLLLLLLLLPEGSDGEAVYDVCMYVCMYV